MRLVGKREYFRSYEEWIFDGFDKGKLVICPIEDKLTILDIFYILFSHSFSQLEKVGKERK